MALFLCPKGLWLIRAMRGTGKAAPVALHGEGGYSLSRKRVSPLNPREKDEGSCPSTPLTLTVCCLKSYNACRIRCGVRGFATSPCESLPVSTAPYYRETRVTGARRQTSCGRGIAALTARWMKQMLQFVGTYDTVITRRCTNGRRLATSSERRW